MIKAKCNKCGGTAFGETFVDASKNINHAVGLSRGIKCGANYNMVCQVGKDPIPTTPKTQTPQESTFTKPKESPVIEKPKTEKPKKTETTKSKKTKIE